MTEIDLNAWSQRCDQDEEGGEPVTMGWRTAKAILTAARERDALKAELMSVHAEYKFCRERLMILSEETLASQCAHADLMAAAKVALGALEKFCSGWVFESDYDDAREALAQLTTALGPRP